MKDLMEKLNDSTTLPIYKIYEATNKLEVEKLEAFVDYCRDSVKHLPHIQPIGQNPTDTAHVQNANIALDFDGEPRYTAWMVASHAAEALGWAEAIKEGEWNSRRDDLRVKARHEAYKSQVEFLLGML